MFFKLCFSIYYCIHHCTVVVNANAGTNFKVLVYTVNKLEVKQYTGEQKSQQEVHKSL